MNYADDNNKKRLLSEYVPLLLEDGIEKYNIVVIPDFENHEYHHFTFNSKQEYLDAVYFVYGVTLNNIQEDRHYVAFMYSNILSTLCLEVD
jgi:hypothetical protein